MIAFPDHPEAARCRRIAEGVPSLRPIVDPAIGVVLIDCVHCRAQDSDELGLYRPAQIIPRDRLVVVICNACHQRSSHAR
jgi:hypothetical protein